MGIRSVSIISLKAELLSIPRPPLPPACPAGASTFSGDGWQPLAGLVQGSDGNFYGTTSAEGTNACQCGNVFRISPSGSYTNLHYFSGLTNDGSTPRATLVQGSDGNFYGTT